MHGVDVDLVFVVHPIENQIITTEYLKTARYNIVHENVKYIQHICPQVSRIAVLSSQYCIFKDKWNYERAVITFESFVK